MPRKDRQFWESTVMSNSLFQMYYNRLVELAVSMFEWTNLPDTVDERYLELALFNDGKAIFFEDDEIGLVALRCAIGGGYDIYNVPIERNAYGANGYQMMLNDKNSIIMFNNYLRTPSRMNIETYARRLYSLDSAIDVNAKAQRTPILIQCDETQRLTMKNLYMKYEGNEPFIFGDKSLDPNSIKVLSTNAPYVADKLYQLRTQIWNEALTYLGISNINVQKKERMVSEEIVRSMGGTIASRYSRLESRRQACEKINAMFGTDIWCDYRQDYREADDEVMFGGDTESIAMTDMALDIRTN